MTRNSDISSLIRSLPEQAGVYQFYDKTGHEICVVYLDDLKSLGYLEATRAGISIGIKDMIIPEAKKKIVKDAQGQIQEIHQPYRD